jgi:hypothetical protein
VTEQNLHSEDRGAGSSLSMVLLAPLFFILSMVAFQSAMWSHARTEARVRARDMAGLIARSGLTPEQAEMEVRASMAVDSLLRSIHLEVEDRGAHVRVELRGVAPGILRGTSAPVKVSTTLWREQWQP